MPVHNRSLIQKALVNWDGDPGYTLGADLNPLNADTDGDGFSDSIEISFGGDPLNPVSVPVLNGDLNGDWEVNAANLLLLQRIIFNK